MSTNEDMNIFWSTLQDLKEKSVANIADVMSTKKYLDLSENNGEKVYWFGNPENGSVLQIYPEYEKCFDEILSHHHTRDEIFDINFTDFTNSKIMMKVSAFMYYFLWRLSIESKTIIVLESKDSGYLFVRGSNPLWLKNWRVADCESCWILTNGIECGSCRGKVVAFSTNVTNVTNIFTKPRSNFQELRKRGSTIPIKLIW